MQTFYITRDKNSKLTLWPCMPYKFGDHWQVSDLSCDGLLLTDSAKYAPIHWTDAKPFKVHIKTEANYWMSGLAYCNRQDKLMQHAPLYLVQNLNGSIRLFNNMPVLDFKRFAWFDKYEFDGMHISDSFAKLTSCTNLHPIKVFMYRFS